MLQLQGNTVQERFLDAVTQLKLKFPVAEIAKKTGYGEPAVSTYLKSNRIVSEKFLKKFTGSYGLKYEDFIYSNGKSIDWGSPKRDKAAEEPTNSIIEETLAQPPKIANEIAANPYFKEVLDMLFAEKDKRIKDLEASVGRLSVQLSEKNNLIKKLKDVETNLSSLLKNRLTPSSKVSASSEETQAH